MGSGLYDSLTDSGLLVKHQEVARTESFEESEAYKILLPDQISFVSYPYEWSFSQLKDAALVTLAAQKQALQNGLVMKDASAYNVQFLKGKPILIDTLSFEPYAGQKVWAAYQQFCQHFLAPLALMAYVDLRMNLMFRDYIDGMPLDLTVNLLPKRCRFNGGLLMHLVLHNTANRRQGSRANTKVNRTTQQASPSNKSALLGLVDSLERTIGRLKLPARLQTVWGKYYDNTNYSPDAFGHKTMLVTSYIKQAKAKKVWDLGGNDGTFSRAALEGGAEEAICFDIDPLAVEKSYQMIKSQQLAKILPIRSDLTNPSPSIGWANAERDSLIQRASERNTVMALALVHHLAIANNLPFDMIAKYFAQLGEYLIVEFIPKTDSKVQILLATRPDIFPNYEQAHFEAAFNKYFKTLQQDQVKDSQRTLYLMQHR